VGTRGAEGVLLTGVYGSGKSSVAEEIAYLLEQRGEPYALLDLDYLSWAGNGIEDRAAEFGLMPGTVIAPAVTSRVSAETQDSQVTFAEAHSSAAESAVKLPLRLRAGRAGADTSS
jgi:hypothetical protein